MPTPSAPAPQIPHVDPGLLVFLKWSYGTEVTIPVTEVSLWALGNIAGKKHVLDFLEQRVREQEQERLIPNVLKQTEDP